MEVETTTLWDLLAQPYATLHFPRFALFLTFAFILEIIVSRKRVNLLCSWSTVATLVAIELAGLLAIYYMLTSVWEGLLTIPIWYYPACTISFLIPTLIFSKGAIILWKDGFRTIAVARSIIFLFAIYFAISTIITPSKLNYIWIKDEPNRIERNHHSAEAYLFRCRMNNVNPPLDCFGDETNKYQTSSGMISFKEGVQYAQEQMNSALVDAAKKFESLTTNSTYSILDDDGFSPEFDQYLETDQVFIEAEDYYYFMKASYNQEILNQIIQDYKKHGKLIDVNWMSKEMHNQ
ncbi:hypothetical protein P4C99_21695 [Pontiellaceae bacterium B1224]|nr:hypothetical protein [Pontiellaceae bacterium B1224]